MTIDEKVEIAKEAEYLLSQLSTYELAVLFESLASKSYRAGTGQYVAYKQSAQAMWDANKNGLNY